jgi:hypothetical protein
VPEVPVSLDPLAPSVLLPLPDVPELAVLPPVEPLEPDPEVLPVPLAPMVLLPPVLLLPVPLAPMVLLLLPLEPGDVVLFSALPAPVVPEVPEPVVPALVPAPEPEAPDPELCAIETPPIAKAATAARAVRVFLVVIMY